MTAALCGVFFVSGVAGLLFETLWFSQAGLVLGNSIWASSLVLAAFMGGLAVGKTTQWQFFGSWPVPVSIMPESGHGSKHGKHMFEG